MSNELHTMPLKIERLLSSQRVRMLELDEFGAYIKLLCDAWLNGGYLRADATSNAYAMQKQCGCNAETAERIIKNVVNVFFDTAENGQLSNKHQLEIYNEVMRKSAVSRLKAGKAAAARWGKVVNATSIPQAMHMQCISNANQSQNQNQSQSINTPIPPEGACGSGVQADPPNSSRKRVTKKTGRVEANTETMIRIGGWFGRRPETLWGIEEAKKLALVNPSAEELDLMEPYYKSKDQYLRRDIPTLLNNWTGELDRARRYKECGGMVQNASQPHSPQSSGRWRTDNGLAIGQVQKPDADALQRLRDAEKRDEDFFAGRTSL